MKKKLLISIAIVIIFITTLITLTTKMETRQINEDANLNYINFSNISSKEFQLNNEANYYLSEVNMDNTAIYALIDIKKDNALIQGTILICFDYNLNINWFLDTRDYGDSLSLSNLILTKNSTIVVQENYYNKLYEINKSNGTISQEQEVNEYIKEIYESKDYYIIESVKKDEHIKLTSFNKKTKKITLIKEFNDKKIINDIYQIDDDSILVVFTNNSIQLLDGGGNTLWEKKYIYDILETDKIIPSKNSSNEFILYSYDSIYKINENGEILWIEEDLPFSFEITPYNQGYIIWSIPTIFYIDENKKILKEKDISNKLKGIGIELKEEYMLFNPVISNNQIIFKLSNSKNQYLISYKI